MEYGTNKTFDNINELIFSFQVSRQKQILNILKKHLENWTKNVTFRIFKKFHKLEIEISDLFYFQDISFLKSVLRFNSKLGIPFEQYLIQRLKWDLLTKLKGFITKKKKTWNYSIEFDENNNNHFKKNKSLIIAENKNYDYLINLLSKFEKEIFILKKDGLKNSEIAKYLNKNIKKIDNAWQRIKIKLKRYIIFNNLNIF